MSCKDNITLSGSKTIGYQVISNNTRVAFAELTYKDDQWSLTFYDVNRYPWKRGTIPENLIEEIEEALQEELEKDS